MNHATSRRDGGAPRRDGRGLELRFPEKRIEQLFPWIRCVLDTFDNYYEEAFHSMAQGF